jgi:hypothetical protein
MSGAVDFAKNVVQATSAPITAPITAVKDLVTEGKNPVRSLGESAAKAVGAAKKVIAPGLQGAGLGPNGAPPVNIADPVDPAKVAEDQAKERQRVKRQAEIDILTDRPGRGGTILTDKYTYNV